MIIAQLSDPHILDESAEADHEHGAGARLQRAVAHLLQLPIRPDVVLVTGDCANNGRPSEYARFRALLRPLPMPVYVIPGNHDDRRVLQQTFGQQGTQPLDGFVQYVVDRWPVRLIALETHIPGRGEGVLCEARLAWLAARLAEAPDRPTILFMHHPPLRTGLPVVDALGLAVVDALGAIVDRHPQVERIVAGHVHAALLRRFHGTIVATCPATTETLLLDVHKPARLDVVREPPVCLLHIWHPDAGLLTYTSVIGDHGPAVTLHDGVRWVG